jgi:hypothetical protein
VPGAAGSRREVLPYLRELLPSNREDLPSNRELLPSNREDLPSNREGGVRSRVRFPAGELAAPHPGGGTSSYCQQVKDSYFLR